jgi:hypothetical protein
MDIRLILLAVLILLLFGMIALAFMGPSVARHGARRLTDIQGRHNGTVNSVEARMKRVISNRTTEKQLFLVSLIPNPEMLAKRIEMTGRKWTLSNPGHHAVPRIFHADFPAGRDRSGLWYPAQDHRQHDQEARV